MTRRSRRTVPALLVGLVLLIAAATLVTSAVQVLLGRRPVVSFDAVASALAGVVWSSPSVLAAAAVAALVGLVLVTVAVLPGPSHVLALAPGSPQDPGSTAGWHRHDLSVRLRRRVRAVEGVTAVTARVRRRGVRVVARTDRARTDELRRTVDSLVSADLDTLDLARRPRVRVRVSCTHKEG